MKTNLRVMWYLTRLHVHDISSALHVDVMQAAEEGLLEYVVYGRVVEDGEQVVHGQDGLTQGLDEEVLTLKGSVAIS